MPFPDTRHSALVGLQHDDVSGNEVVGSYLRIDVQAGLVPHLNTRSANVADLKDVVLLKFPLHAQRPSQSVGALSAKRVIRSHLQRPLWVARQWHQGAR